MKGSFGQKLAVAFVTVAVAGLATGCSSDAEPAATPESAATESSAQTPSAQEPAAPPEAAETTEIEITENGFKPDELKVPAGTKVTWTNAGSKDHNITFFTDSRTLGMMKPGESASVLFNTPGEYRYADVYDSDLVALSSSSRRPRRLTGCPATPNRSDSRRTPSRVPRRAASAAPIPVL